MKLFKRVLVFTLAIAILSIISVGQKSAEKKEERLSTVEVKANVMVLDAANSYVKNVEPEDIKIFEDDVEQKITAFTPQELQLHIVLLIDNSGSLRTEQKRIENAAATVVVNLGPKDEASIVRFVSSDKIEVVQEWTSDQTKLLATIKDALYTEGVQSAVVDAVYLAVGKLKDRKGPGAKTILLLSDCEDRESFYSRKNLFKLLEGTDIRIFTVAVTQNLSSSKGFIQGTKKEAAEELAKSLAFKSGGGAYILDKKIDESIAAALRSVMIELRSQYVVSYTSTNQKRGTTRKLRIEVGPGKNGEKRQAFIRESVYVPKD